MKTEKSIVIKIESKKNYVKSTDYQAKICIIVIIKMIFDHYCIDTLSNPPYSKIITNYTIHFSLMGV